MLKPCPCCGSKEIHGAKYEEQPYCVVCGLQATSIEEWNTRTLPVEIQAVLDAVEGYMNDGMVEQLHYEWRKYVKAAKDKGVMP